MLPIALAAIVCSTPLLIADPPAGASFAIQRTRMPAGVHRAVCCTLAQPAPADLPLPLVPSDAAVLVVERQPVFLAGQRTAFARVRSLAPGVCELRSDAMAAMTIEVAPAQPLAPPRIISPAPGAVVWGTIDVGITFSDLEGVTRGTPGVLSLRLPGGVALPAPIDELNAAPPLRRAVCRLDTSAIQSPTLSLEPVWTGERGEQVVGPPVQVRVAHPTPADAPVFEAESLAPVARPPRFAAAPNEGSSGADPGASAGKYLNNPGPEPAFCIPLKVEQDGWYQVCVTARGTPAGGAYPSLGLVIDNNQFATTNTRLFDGAWRRVALGVPVRISAGDRVLTTWYDNDFYAEKLGDRNLQIDKAEVLRVPDDAAPTPLASNSCGMPMMVSPSALGRPALASPGTDAWGLEPRALRVAFQRPLEGLPAAGELLVEGLCWWEGEGVRAPRVELLLDGKAVGVQRSAVPRFILDPSAFGADTCTLQLVATLDNGAQDRTPVQTIRTRAASAAPVRRYIRYTAHDDLWDPGTPRSPATEKYPPERAAVTLMANAEALLNLPDDLAGSFDVFVETLGQDFDGPPIAVATLVTPDARTPIGETSSHAWWVARPVGKVELTPGPKKLGIAFTNDKFEEGKGDRNLWFQAVVLHESPPPDAAPPTARVLYPAPDARIGTVDAVVAEFADDRNAQRVELLLDGVPTGVSRDVLAKPGRVLLPVVLRGVAEGPHTLAVRVTDAAGASVDSAPVAITHAPTSAGDLGRYDRAVRILNRLGYGPEPLELAALLVEGEDAWLTRSLTGPLDAGELSAYAFAAARFPGARSEYEVMRRPVTHALLTTNSVRSRFVLFARNHFSTWIRKAEPDRACAEYATFAQLGAAPFFDLLMASATSSSMLRYLDQEQSYSGRINENYAREIMELHTLGVHAGYSQADVTALARLLTGWTTAREGDGAAPGELRGFAFAFDPTLCDPAGAELLGVRFPDAMIPDRYDRARSAIELLAAHPATARFICAKLAAHYVSEPPPADLVDALVDRFNATGGDLAQVMLALAHHPAFLRPDLPDRVQHPLPFALRIARTTGHMQPWLVGDFLQRSANALFDRSTPDGYPEDDAAYVDSNAMIQRWRFAKDSEWAIASLVPDALRYGDVPADAPEAERWAQRVVDLVAVGLTGRLLSETSNDAALKVVLAGDGARQDHVVRAAPFIAQLPDVSLR
jgi:uncharacterized protein (DUF1800 family)